MRLVARHRRDPLDEVEDGLRLASFLGEHRLDDLRRLRLAEAALAQKCGPVLVCARDDALTGLGDAVDEGLRRRVSESCQRRRGLVREARGGVFRVPDGDFLKSSTPQRLRFWQTARR